MDMSFPGPVVQLLLGIRRVLKLASSEGLMFSKLLIQILNEREVRRHLLP